MTQMLLLHDFIITNHWLTGRIEYGVRHFILIFIAYPLLRQLKEGNGWLRAASLLRVLIFELLCQADKLLCRTKQKTVKPKLA